MRETVVKREILGWIFGLIALLWAGVSTYDKTEAEKGGQFRDCILSTLNESLDRPPSCWSEFSVKKLNKNDLDYFGSWTNVEKKTSLDSRAIFKAEFSDVSRKSFPLTDQVVEISRVYGGVISSRQRYYILYFKGDVVGICEGVPLKL